MLDLLHPIPERESNADTPSLPGNGMLRQNEFTRMLMLEHKRTERSRRRFVLMLLEAGALLNGSGESGIFEEVLRALSASTRDTDIRGWYRDGSVIGVIFTEIGAAEGRCVASALLMKVTQALSGALSIEQINRIDLSFHVYPDDSETSGRSGPPDKPLDRDKRKKLPLIVKRIIDVTGSSLLVLLLLPLLAAIALAIKLTSRGPVLFRQVRVGRYGRPFTFLKFRSMCHGSDPAIHRDFVTQYIKGGKEAAAGSQPEYKITADPRITPLGRFLRKTSLDELPQFFNVLLGDMSLVGPRPPVPYEFECYELWHRRRLIDVKPGITGLWQVTGRSRVTFDEMVRLDLRYARSWSLWLDLRILLETPRAVLSGAGAY